MLLFVFGLTLREGAGEILSMLGMMGTATGSLLFLQNISDHWESWAYEWAPPAPTAASVLVLPFFLNMGVHTQKGVGP